jgi:hypothetical protein
MVFHIQQKKWPCGHIAGGISSCAVSVHPEIPAIDRDDSMGGIGKIKAEWRIPAVFGLYGIILTAGGT